MNKQIKISRIAIIVVFLALIRCISEVFRIQYYSATTFSYDKIKPFLLGALAAAIAALVMIILSFYQKHKLVIVMAIVAIISLFVLKYMYL